jgi:hypothetical protein
MRRPFVGIAVALVVVSGTLVASAKSVSDPNETSVSDRDIRTAALTRPTSSTFAWKMVTWDSFGSSSLTPGGMTLYLDTKGGTANDAIVELSWDLFSDELICQVEKPSGSFVASGTASRPSTKSALCKFPKSALTLDKTIRWRTTSESVGATDKAPNSGYVRGV